VRSPALLVLLVVHFVVAIGCGDDDATTPPPMSDGGSGGDAGRDSGARRDAGVADSCEASEETAADTVGCNGAPPGPAADDAFGGRCMPSATEARGSCTDPESLCDGDETTAGGICTVPCDASAMYVSNGGCPPGSRCFNLGGEGWCYPDCNSDTDCATDFCDLDGSCYVDYAPEDAGVPEDAAIADDAGVAPVDAGDMDAS